MRSSLANSTVETAREVTRVNFRDEVVLYIPESKLYVGLEETALVIWENIEKLEPVLCSDLVKSLSHVYELSSSDVSGVYSF